MTIPVSAQVYIEKQTRHRFAQLNLGVDYQVHLGGDAVFLNQDGTTSTYNLSPFHRPRLVIGGTHFWGHADFYIAFSLYNPEQSLEQGSVGFATNVETALKYYPWHIEQGKIRPYLGIMLAPFTYRQNDADLTYSQGPDLVVNSWPLMAGLTFNRNNQLFELGLAWNYNNEHAYYISRDHTAQVSVPPLSLNLSYRLMLETTLGAEKNWENGKTAEVTRKLASDGGLNSLFVGAGISSMFWQNQGSYNSTLRPYIGDFDNATFADFALGYYFNNPDLNITLNYRGMKSTAESYGTLQDIRRRSLGLEITKYLFDYHGFVPFAGSILSYEFLGFSETHENLTTQNKYVDKPAMGVAFGWDIRPNRLQSFILRTNLRWYPRLQMNIDGAESINFGGLEFNFIQLIIYPERMF